MLTRILLAVTLASTLVLTSVRASAAELLQDQPFIPATSAEAGGGISSAPGLTRIQVIADRFVYFTDDLNGQFLVTFLGATNPAGDPTQKIALSLKNEQGEVASKMVGPVKSPKLPVLIPVSELKPGHYTLTAALVDKSGRALQQPSVAFTVAVDPKPHIPFPAEGVAINVHPQAFVPDTAWPICTGVPMPVAALKDKDVAGFALLENGKPTPAQFSIRATWSPKGYVKWVGLDFVAKYDQGKPRAYQLVQDPAKHIEPAHPLVVKDEANGILVDTGAIKFVIGRKPFAGLEKVWVSRTGNGVYTDQDLVVDGRGGPFIVDDQGTRYDTIHAKDVQVVVEESGPVSALIAAKGWYYDVRGNPLCQFVTRFKVFAGQPYVTISHRTINTIFDQYYKTRLADVGFETAVAGKVEKWRFGFDGKTQGGQADGQPGSVYLHQDRDDHLRLMNNEASLAEGKHSDGWMNATAGNGSITYLLRDIWQKFPKEMEVDTTAEHTYLTAHLWPKHGHKAFTDEEELSRQNIYKAHFAEEGKVLNFLIPDNYVAKLEEFNKEEPFDNGHDFDHHVMDIKGARKDRVKIQNETGMGTVIGGDLVIWFAPKPEEDAELTARAALVQQSPHGLADPVWNCCTDVFGPIAPRDPAKFGPAESLIDDAFVFYQRSIIDGADEYGMWTYGDLHEDFRPNINSGDLYRVWQHDHYQNVFQAWLLYFRAGTPELFNWARIEGGHEYDVGVNNYYAYPPGIHAYSSMGDIGGSLHHWGLLPWTGTLSDMHWLDITQYFIDFDLTGDRRGLDLAALWSHTRGVVRFPARPNIPSTVDAFQNEFKMHQVDTYQREHKGQKPAEYPQWVKDELAKPEQFSMRDNFVPLGETVQYYEGTWDPQALLYLDQWEQYQNPPIEAVHTYADLTSFGKHWQDWYYGLTRDQRVIDHLRSFLKSDTMTDRLPADKWCSLVAFLYNAAGDTWGLKQMVSKIYDDTLNIYRCPGDRWDGYCMAQSNPNAMLLGRLPFFLHAVDAAGLKFQHYEDDPTTLPVRNARTDMGDKWLGPPRGWSGASMTVLALASPNSPFVLSIDSPRTMGNMNATYLLTYGFPELNFFSRPKFSMKDYEQQEKSLFIKLQTDTQLDYPPNTPTFRSFNGDMHLLFPYLDHPANDPSKLEYRLEYGGTPLDFPVFRDAKTDAPLPQVAVLPRIRHFERTDEPASVHSVGVCNAWFRPLDPHAKVTMRFESVHVRYWEPTTVRISDSAGNVIIDSSVYMLGQRKEVTATLDPAKNPLPWRIMIASASDNKISFEGPDELIFATKKADFDTILPKIQIYHP